MTKIEWIHRPGTIGTSWNPVSGCDKISEGCRNCYAERMSNRLAGRFGYPLKTPFAVTLHEDKLPLPLTWPSPRTVFVCSTGDLFHDGVSYSYIDRVMRIIARCETEHRGHAFLILTKRPLRMHHYFAHGAFMSHNRNGGWPWWTAPLSNLWLGATAENQRRLKERAWWLWRCPASVRFVSLEPLLSPIDLEAPLEDEDGHVTSLDYLDMLDWVIVGEETGPGRRLTKDEWVENVIAECQRAACPVFVKPIRHKAEQLLCKQWPVVIGENVDSVSTIESLPKERTTSMEQYTHRRVSRMPARPQRFGRSKWDWLRDIILNEMRPGDIEVFDVPTKKEGKQLQSAAQNASSIARKGPRGRHLPSPQLIQTALEAQKDGTYKVYVRVFIP